jgi:colicin import membrane protein
MATYFDAYGNPVKPKSAGWILPLLVLVLASAGANYWLWKERSKTTAEAFSATAKLAATEAMQKEMAQQLEKLEAEKKELVEAKEQAIKDAKEKSLELAKLKDDVAGVEVKNEPEKEAAADDKGKAGAKGKDAKDEKTGKEATAKAADKKADAKAEAKSKAKPKAKKKSADASHKKDSSKESPEREL